MNHYFKAFFWVLSRMAGLLVLFGLVAGIIADVPGVGETEIGGPVLTFMSVVLTSSLKILYQYPLGVFVCLIVVSLVRWMVIYPHDEKLKMEVEAARRKRRSSPAKQSGKKKKPRRRK